MENKKLPSQNKLLYNQKEKPNHQVKYGSGAGCGSSKKRLLQDSCVIQNKAHQEPVQGFHVAVNPRIPAIKTIFLAEKSRFNSRRGSEKSRSVLAIGDHPSSNQFAGTRSSSAKFKTSDKTQPERQRTNISKLHQVIKNRSQVVNLPGKLSNTTEKCHVYSHPGTSIKNDPNLERNLNKKQHFNKSVPKHINADSSDNKNASIIELNNRIKLLKRLARKQEMVLGDYDSHNSQSSSDEDSRDNMRNCSASARPGCSYIEHYSHIPETSAFQRYAQQSSSLSPSKGIEKEHNSEQYGRDFTAYDGLTARGRRQTASATSKRDDVPLAAERMVKIRHKLNPVRDYRLMDTVHYLAQGEFAPRNDGIKLTPSREAVLSDIIWEDVCRTHWPTARLGRRHTQQQDRNNTRSELQRLIDSLLRERVAHVERRRRRHYRIVKHTQHSAGRVGKTGDIIVASHKDRHRDENDVPTGHTHHASGLMMSSNRWPDQRSHRSDDRLTSPERRRVLQEDCTPGPSYAAPRSRREPTCCYHAGTSKQPEPRTCQYTKEKYSSTSTASEKHQRNPRLVVKKDPSRRKYHEKELNLEHFILLPTLVVRTPSNVKRQKKFNELYHRILNQLSNEQTNTESQPDPHCHRSSRKDSATSMNRGKNKQH